MHEIKTRFAPSPTGFLHLGGLRTALYNYLFAKQNSGEFILRIEDTDRARLVDGAEENIIETLKTFGLYFDKGPIRQSENLDRYRECTQELINKGAAYKDGDAVRFKMIKDGATVFEDIIRGEIKIENKLQEDFVILKSDGYPTYNLAHLVDDHDMAITHVIRGEEFISSMPKYAALHRAFDWEIPRYAHLPLLLDKNRAKLSKREGEMSVYDFLHKGYLKEAIINFVALLGWHPSKSDKELFSLEELTNEFRLEHVQKSGAIFDMTKLDWINREYIKRMPVETLFERVKEYGEKDQSFKIGGVEFNKERVLKILELEKPRLTTFSELPKIFFMFNVEPKYNPELLKWKKMTNAEINKSLEISNNIIESIDDANFTKEYLEKIFLEHAKEFKDRGELLWPFRAALSGKESSPGPFEISEILGKEESLRRVKKAIELLRG